MTNLNNATQRICGNYHAPAPLLDAWIQCWPFDAKWCSHCGDVGVEWGPVKQFAFDVLIGWWWAGAVLVKDSENNY